MTKERALPSIGMISLLNTYKQLNCVTLSDSGAVLAAGMADCTVKVFILSKQVQDVLTVEDMVKEQIRLNLKMQDDQINGVDK